MKKVKILLMVLTSFMIIYVTDTYAASATLNVSTSQVYVGDSFTASISVNASAAWNVKLVASGPVRNCSINQADSTADALNTNKVFSATCTSTGVGTITLTLEGDVTSADNGLTTKVGGTKTVNVVARPANPTPSNPTPQPSNPTPSGPADTRSTNTKLSKLTVNGVSLSNVNNVFTMEVGNYVEKVDINAVVADSKAKVSGTGNKELKVGENSFNVVVTAERGNTTTYTVKVIRKEFNSISDLDEVLKLGKDAEVQFGEKDKLSKEQIDSIIKSKKKITFTRYDEEKKRPIYSFILDGNSIKSTGEFNPNISLEIEDNKDMEEAVNYAAGLYLDLSNCGSIPKGTILKFFVGDIYNDNDKVNFYSYDGSKVIQLKEGTEVVNGYVEFSVSGSIKHLISKTKVANAEVKKEGIDIWMITTIALGVLVFILLIALITKKPKKEKIEEVKVEAKKEENTTIVEAPKVTESVENVVTTTINVSDVVEKAKDTTNEVPEIVETLPMDEKTEDKNEEVLEK